MSPSSPISFPTVSLSLEKKKMKNEEVEMWLVYDAIKQHEKLGTFADRHFAIGI
ncbi:unnamed protein product [Periconia digitata]|uniref:Uncharacterized protein n=1 Tax=Periconia digitata TaxID=1303443 RepID=A0A9W4UAR0_9PLEO|nr:unnamed protein product [Periconia digitata]